MGKKKLKNGPRPILTKKQNAELATTAGSNNKSITVRSNVDASGNRVLTARRVGKCAPLQAPPVKATNPDAVNSTPASPGTPELPAPRVRELAGDLLQPLGLGGVPVGSFEGFQASLPGFQAKMMGELLEELQEQAREVREVAFVKKHVWVYAIDHPTYAYGRLIVKEHPFKRDFNGSQMKCEKRAAKDMPVSARYATILVCASTDQGFVGLTREAGVTASDLEDGLWWRPLEPAVKEQLGGLWEGIDSEVSWQQELVDKSLRMAATGLLSMADMRKLGIMFRDYKGDNILWDPIHKVWVLIDYGITQLRDFAKEPFKGGYTPGYVDPRAFLQRDSEGELLIGCMTSMWRICDWSSEVAIFFLGVLKLLNGRLPGPYQPYNQALSSDDPADIRAANARMAQELPEWLASLPSLQGEMFDFIRDDYPQLCSYIARAFSANVDERPTLADWLQLPELRSTLRSVLQREEAAQRAVEQQTAAIRALGDRIAADSSAEAGLLRWQQQQQQEKEWLCNLEEGMRAEGPKEALFRENAVRKEGQKQMAPLQREKQYLQQQLEWQHLLLPGDMQQQLHQQHLQQYEAEQQQRRREWKAAKQPLWNQRLFLQQEPKSPVEAKYRELQLKQQNESAVLKLQQEIKQLQRQEQMQRQQAFEMLLQLRPAILPAAEGPMEALYREQLLIDESKVLMELLEQKQQHLQQQQLLPNYQQHAAQHQQHAKQQQQQQQQQQQEEEEEVLSEQQQLWRERLQERHEPESPEEAADRQRWLQDHIRRVLQRMQRDSKQMQRQLLRQQWAQKRAAEVLEGALLREAAILEEMGAHIQPLQQKQLLLQQQLQYLQQYQHQQPHQQEPMQQQQEEEEGEAGKQQQMWQQRLQEREAPQSTEEAVYRQQWLQCNLHQALQQVQHENEQLQQHVRRLKQLAYQNHPYWVLAAAATAAAAAAATATAA